jgi:glyoxylase-like metal-dependent hydrolase (beta-lactamase superfamily II)
VSVADIRVSILKKWKKAGLVVLVMIAVALSAILIPAHLQVRSVNSPIPGPAEFAQLKRADGPTNIYFINTAEQQLPASVLSHSAFVLEWSDGSLFLIDAGMQEARAVEFGALIELILGGEETITHGTVASLLGDNISRLAGVGFTHLHIDHTQGVTTLCKNSEIRPLLLQTDFQQRNQNFNTREGSDILADSCFTPGTVNGGPIFTSERFPGLGLVAVGGHTPGSTLFAAWLGDHLYLFSGDITNSRRELVEDLGKGWIYSNLLVPEDTGRTKQLRHWLRELSDREDTSVIVSHDLDDIRASGLQQFDRTINVQ